MKKSTTGALAISALLIGINSAYGASVIPECANANPDSVTDVQNCIARHPQMGLWLQQAAMNPAICGVTKEVIEKSRETASPGSTPRVPSCDTIAQAVTQLNGVRPLWAECTHYDGSQQALNRCTASYLKQQSGVKELDCFSFKMQIAGAISGASDTPFDSRKNAPSCEMISSALASVNIRMTGAECLGYRPNDQQHMERCLKPSLLSTQNMNRKFTCDELRQHYRGRVASAMSDPSQTSAFVIPTCPMIESAAKSIFASAGVTTNATAAMPSVPAAAAPAGYPQGNLNTPGYPPAAYPSANYPAAQQNNGGAQYGAYSTEAKKQQKEMERAAKTQGNINAANQVLGTLGMGGIPVPPAAGQPNTSTGYNAAPVAGETEEQRKAREAQQKVNQATETVNAVKGIFNAFGGGQ